MNRPARPIAPRVIVALAAGALALAGCGRMERIGQPPDFTAPGTAERPAPPPTARRIALATPPPDRRGGELSTASLWRSGPASLFGDRRARTFGDILTVVIEIDDEAEIQNGTDRSRSSSEELGASALFGLPSLISGALDLDVNPAVGVESSSSTSGQGAVRRNEQITLRIAATVVDVLPNGHLVVAGNQEVRVNFELRDLQVAGIVRPEDISRRNEITYDKMAEARIAYGGRGQITDMQQPRYGQQVLDVVLPF